MFDNLSSLQTLVTKSVSFDGAGVDLGKYGTPRTGLVARVLVPSYRSAATAGTTFRFKIGHSADNTTFTDLVLSDTLTGATAANTKEIALRFETDKRYVRLSVEVVSATGSTNTVAYVGDITLAKYKGNS